MAAINGDRRIRDVRDIWNMSGGGGGGGVNKHEEVNKENPSARICYDDKQAKNKYKTLERHLSMKKTIRKKMMRDLREIGDAGNDQTASSGEQQTMGFLEQIRTDQPPSANIDKPSLWKRLTKGWGHA